MLRSAVLQIFSRPAPIPTLRFRRLLRLTTRAEGLTVTMMRTVRSLLTITIRDFTMQSKSLRTLQRLSSTTAAQRHLIRTLTIVTDTQSDLTIHSGTILLRKPTEQSPSATISQVSLDTPETVISASRLPSTAREQAPSSRSLRIRTENTL